MLAPWPASRKNNQTGRKYSMASTDARFNCLNQGQQDWPNWKGGLLEVFPSSNLIHSTCVPVENQDAMFFTCDRIAAVNTRTLGRRWHTHDMVADVEQSKPTLVGAYCGVTNCGSCLGASRTC